MNCCIIEAADGPGVLRKAAEEKPHLIFLDLVMPGMSGFEVLDTLKSDPALKHIPVIIVTSKILEDEERKRLAAKTLTIISKDAPRREAIAQIKTSLKK